jgi:tetratricopeptide (TPR) repeat protein
MAHHQGHDGHGWRLADPVASYFDRRGYMDDSQLVRETALLSTRAVGDRVAEGSFFLGLGMGQMTTADFVAAHRSFDSARRLFGSQAHARGQAASLHQLGRLAAFQDDPATATRLFRESLEIAQKLGDMEGQSWTSCLLAHVLISLEQYEQAETLLFESIWLAKRISDRLAHARALAGVGAVCLARGDLETASSHCAQALTLAESVPDITVTAQVCLTLAEIAAKRRETSQANGYALRAISLSKATHSVVDEARALDVLGAVAHSEGELADSVSAWREAVTLYQRAGNSRLADAVQLKLNDVELSIAATSDGRGNSGAAQPRPGHWEWRPVTR